MICDLSPNSSHIRNFFRPIFKCQYEVLALLFSKDETGRTVYDYFSKYGMEYLWDVLLDLVPAHTQRPILHYVINHAPQHLDDFAARYPNATFLRDEHEQSLTQSAISSVSKIFSTGAMFFVRLADYEIEEVDPVSELYPFATAAAAPGSD